MYRYIILWDKERKVSVAIMIYPVWRPPKMSNLSKMEKKIIAKSVSGLPKNPRFNKGV